METALNQRVRQVMRKYGLNGVEFSDRIGMKQPTFASKLRGERDFRIEDMHAIVSALPEVSESWLLTGQGEMLSPPSSDAGGTIRYYPNVDGTMGGIEFADNPDESFLPITIPGYADCTIAVNAYGNSMAPLIRSGQILLLIEWKDAFIDWGKIYLVVSRTGYRCVKYLFPAPDSSSVVCRSQDSQLNPDFEIRKDDILHLFLVKGWICREAI